MRMRIAVPDTHVEPPVIDAALEAVTRLDESLIRSGEAPQFKDAHSGVRWRPENLGDEHFDHANTVLGRGWGDCDDLAPWHAGSLRASGEDPGAIARVVPTADPNTYHAIVQRSDGSFEDPSVTCGMKAKRGNGASVVGGIDDDLMRIWALDPHDGRIYQGSLAPTIAPLPHDGPAFAVRQVQGGFEARCDMPWVGSPLVPCVGRACARPRIHVKAYTRRMPHHGRVHGIGDYNDRGVRLLAVPTALSTTAYGHSPHDALNRAVVGAILTGDAAEGTSPIDRCKLLAVQGLLAGMTSWDVTAHLERHVQGAAHIVAPLVGAIHRVVGC